MRCLVIYTHPATKGYCPFIKDEVEAELKKKKIEYEILDLYKMKYDPVLHEKEHYTSGGREVSRQNKEIQKKIKSSDTLIFIYPVWWYSPPAMLKGFLDRVLTPYFAFKYENNIPIGLLEGKDALVFITTGGPKFYYTVTGNMPGRLIKSILHFCGLKTRLVHFGNMKAYDEKRLPSIKDVVREEINSLLR